MLNIIVNIFFILGVFIYGFKDYKKSVLIYVIGTFVAPVLRIDSLYLSFDVICFPLLLLLSIPNTKVKIRFSTGDGVSFLPYLLVYLVMTMFGSVLYGGGISVATIYAILRFIIVLHIIQDVWQGELIQFLDKVLGWVLLLNIVCCIIQVTNLLPVEFFYNLYYKTSMKPLFNQLELGYFNRAYGTTGSPVILGGIAVLSYAFYIATYASSQFHTRVNILKLIGSALCGLLALSKTAIIAIPAVSILTFVMCALYYESSRVKSLLKVFGAVIIGTIVLFYVVLWMNDNGFAISYYLQFLKDPLKSLTTRYDDEVGNLSKAIDVIRAHPIFGVGHATFDDTFVGDSVYIVLLYQTGICGLIAYFVPYVVSFVRSFKKKLLVSSAILFAFVLIAIGNASQLSYYLIPFVAIAFDASLGDTAVQQD